MKKKFTIAVPDQLFFPEISGNNKLTLTYNGLDSIILLVDKSSGKITGMLETLEDAYNKDNDEPIVVNASENPEVCYFVTAEIPNHETEENVLQDGTKIKKIKNPSITDYFNLFYNFEDLTWKFNPVVKDHETPSLKRARDRYTFLKSAFYDLKDIDNGGSQAVYDAVSKRLELDLSNTTPDEVVSIIANYLEELNNIIEVEKNKNVWELDVLDVNLPEPPTILTNILKFEG